MSFHDTEPEAKVSERPLAKILVARVMLETDELSGKPYIWHPDHVDPAVLKGVTEFLESGGYLTEPIHPGTAEVGTTDAPGLKVWKRNTKR